MGLVSSRPIVGQEVLDYCGAYRATIWIFGSILEPLILRKISEV